MKPSRVLVTGGAGFIGSFTAERFEREGWIVRVLDDLSSGKRSNCADSWDLRVANIRDPSAIADAVSDCSAVVHLAAFTSVPESFERHEACYRTNVGGNNRPPGTAGLGRNSRSEIKIPHKSSVVHLQIGRIGGCLVPPLLPMQFGHRFRLSTERGLRSGRKAQRSNE